MFGSRTTSALPTRETALPGRDTAIVTPGAHFVHGRPIGPPFPKHLEIAHFGMGCFWGAERIFWPILGVYTTAVGYGGGVSPNPTYEEVCSGHTGHTELVLVAYDPAAVSFEDLAKAFWEGHDPTQGMRQGNDRGTQYRSAIYVSTGEQLATAEATRSVYEERLGDAGYGAITTEIATAGTFYYAEDYHQQYLVKNPNGYCGIGGTGVSCPMPAAK